MNDIESLNLIEEEEKCLLCLESKNLIIYNHCGEYKIHKKCLKKWNSFNKYKKCIICNENLSKRNKTLCVTNVAGSEREITINSVTSNVESNDDIYFIVKFCIFKMFVILFFVKYFNYFFF